MLAEKLVYQLNPPASHGGFFLCTTQMKQNNQVIHVRLTQLFPHPDNRPLGINEEKVEQLAEMMRQNGFDPTKLLKVRSNGTPDTYQIIEGEHRWRAAQKAGIETVPAYVIDVDDEEALIQLLDGNIQSERNSFDIGRVALKVCKKDSKKGYSMSAFAKRIGETENRVSRGRKAEEVRFFLEQSGNIARLHDNDAVYYEWSKCEKLDWPMLYPITDETVLSIEISKRIRSIDKAAKEHAAKVFDLTEVKQEVATAKERAFNNWLSLIESVEDCANKLYEVYELFRYNFKDKDVESYEYLAREVFLSRLSNIKKLTRAEVFKAYESALKTIKQQTKGAAESDKEYYLNESNNKEREERERAEWEMFMPQVGSWYELGPHKLYCGDNMDEAFIDALPDNAAFAFADPPYNAGVDDWDEGFAWEQDYLQDKADFVFVTPGTNAIKDLMNNTEMNYRWSLFCWIKNGMTKGALGFNNTIFIALFSKIESVFKNMGDHFNITIKVSETEDTEHEGRKPYDLLKYLIENFSEIGNTVIDPFAGSGTTLLECEKNKRICITAEKNEAYCKEIIGRYNKLKAKSYEDSNS